MTASSPSRQGRAGLRTERVWRPSPLSRCAIAYIETYYPDLAALPEPEAEWRYLDLPEQLQQRHFGSILDRGIVTAAGSERIGGERRGRRTVWETDADAYDFIQRLLARADLLPCGHRPFSNPRDVDGLSCSHPDCEETYDEATVREVLA